MGSGFGCAVVMSKPAGELEAENALRRRGFRTFLPLWRRRLRRDRVVMRPLFTGYLFVLLAPDEPWIAILHAPGIEGVSRRMGSRRARAASARSGRGHPRGM